MTLDGLYQAYIRERQGLESLWREHGFIIYRITGSECFLVDMFIEKSERRSGRGRLLLEELEKIAIDTKCNVITANIHLSDPNANKTLLASMACGFALEACGNNVLLIAKKLKE